MNKIAVILLGAGAPISWGAPNTKELTNLLFEDNQYLTKQGENVAKFIHDILRNGSDEIIHFEHILDSIESIENFIRDDIKFKSNTKKSSYLPAWFNLNDNYKKLENFRLEKKLDTGNSLIINLAKDLTDTPLERPDQTVKTSYFNIIKELYLNKISDQIARYDILSESYKILNDNFYKFINQLHKKGYTARIYTTNYDELFLKILNYNNINIFNGFDSTTFLPDIKKILNDSNINCYYNLHGSIHWGLDFYPEIGIETFRNRDYNCKYLYPFNNRITIPSNPQEETQINNIVIGFKKIQKISINPLNAFFTRLSMDCVNADLVTSIGYSFSDPHINRLIGNAVQFNQSKFLNVTKNENFWRSTDYTQMLEYIINGKNPQDFSKNGSWLSYKRNDSVKIFTDGFDRFLEDNELMKFVNWLQ